MQRRVRDPKLVKGYQREKGSISFLYCFKKGLKFSIYSWNISFASAKPDVESRK